MVLALVAVLSGGPAEGQSAVTLERVEVALWPEYDRPGMLVIYRVALAPSTTLPASLSFTIPAAVGVPNAVAQQSGGNLVTLPYDRVVDGETAEIRFAASERMIQLEYYDPTLEREGDARSYTYDWAGDYAVSDLTFTVQEPAGATEFATSPPAAASAIGADGLAYHTLPTGSMAPGQTARVAISYSRAGEDLTVQIAPPPVSAAPPAAAGPPATRTAGSQGDWTTAVVVALLVLGVAGLALGIAGRMRRGAAVERGGPTGGRKSGRFCTACGEPLRAGDRFCAGCGKRARNG